MKVMMEKGAPVDTQNEGGQTPLHKAVAYRRLSAAKFLLDRGANPNAEINAKKYPFWSGTPLHEAAENGDAKMFDLLVEYGANINAKDAYGRTPVLKAAKTDSSEDHGVN
jgi:ankyrin repeat protein